MTTTLPGAVQHAADYADAIEQQLQHASAQPSEQDETGNSPKDSVSTQERSGEDEVEKLRAKYSSLQGKYNAEVPELHQRLKEMEASLQKASDENIKLRQEIADQEAKKSYITDQDTEAYGQDMVDLIRRGAREESAKYARQATDLKARVDAMEARLRNEAAAMENQRMQGFYATLTSLCPDWREQNSDPAFLEWLGEADPIYGFQRNSALQNAFNAGDAERVAQIFTAFRDKGAKKRNGLARQVTPAHSRSAASPAPTNGKKTFSQAEISDFYDKWIHGQISDEDAARIEQEINSAVAEGRVTP